MTRLTKVQLEARKKKRRYYKRLRQQAKKEMRDALKRAA